MKTIGYVNALNTEEYTNEQIDALKEFRVDEIICEGEESQNGELLNEIVLNLKDGDRVVVYELSCLGKSVIQLAAFLKEFKKKHVQLIEVKKETDGSNILDDTYIDMILKIADMEKSVIRERTTKGLKEARRKGRIGGRPRISQETVDRIKSLYKHNRYTLRQIAEECNISLGTAYKYVQKN